MTTAIDTDEKRIVWVKGFLLSTRDGNFAELASAPLTIEAVGDDVPDVTRRGPFVDQVAVLLDDAGAKGEPLVIVDSTLHDNDDVHALDEAIQVLVTMRAELARMCADDGSR